MSKSTKNFIIVILAFVLVFTFLPSLRNSFSELNEEKTTEEESSFETTDESTAIDEPNEESSVTDEESSDEETESKIYVEEDITNTVEFAEGYVSTDGVIKENVYAFRYSKDVITLHKGESLTIKAKIPTNVGGISFWNSEGTVKDNLICTIAGTSSDVSQYTYTAEETVYIRLSYKETLETITLTKQEDGNYPVLPLLHKKTFTFDGDSIIYGQRNNGVGWADIIAEENRMITLNDFSKSGARLTTTSDNSICDRITTISNESDYIIISAGYNDYKNGCSLGALSDNGENLDTTTVIGATEYIAKYLKENFSDKKVGFVLTHKTGNEWTTEINGYSLQEHHQAVITVLEKYDIPYIDIATLAEFDVYNLDVQTLYFDNVDIVHPNELGYRTFYVPYIEAWLKTL